MPYTSNPHMPHARMKARNDVVWRGLSKTQAANKYGVCRTTIWRWVKRAEKLQLNGNSMIETLPSRPKHHPNELDSEIVSSILTLRKRLGRCAPVLHAHLKMEGIIVSLSSVERVLRRYKLTRRKKQTKDYLPIPKPKADFPGSLLQMDTIHFVKADYSRCYVFTIIDLFSRLSYAEYHPNISHRISYSVILNAQKYFGFDFQTIQTDHGLEFSPSLSYKLRRKKIILRHSRIRKPNDNAHIERFNRTIQEECFQGRLPEHTKAQRQIRKYLDYYNNRRLHLSLDLKTPTEYVAKVLN